MRPLGKGPPAGPEPILELQIFSKTQFKVHSQEMDSDFYNSVKAKVALRGES